MGSCLLCARGLRATTTTFPQFSGHAVIPSIARDMRHPEEFDSMINYAFVRGGVFKCEHRSEGAILQVITTIVYGAVGACGYLMFGDDVSDEVNFFYSDEVGMIVVADKFLKLD